MDSRLRGSDAASPRAHQHAPALRQAVQADRGVIVDQGAGDQVMGGERAKALGKRAGAGGGEQARDVVEAFIARIKRVEDWQPPARQRARREAELRLCGALPRGDFGDPCPLPRQDIFRAQRMAMPWIAHHPAKRLGGLKRAGERIARQRQAVDQRDKTRALMRANIGEDSGHPALLAKRDQIVKRGG